MLFANEGELIFSQGKLSINFDAATELYLVKVDGKEVLRKTIHNLKDSDEFLELIETYAVEPIPHSFKVGVSKRLQKGMAGPTPIDLLQTAEALKTEALEIVDNTIKDDCPKNKDEVVKPKPEEETSKEFFCTCQLPKETRLKLSKDLESIDSRLSEEEGGLLLRPFSLSDRFLGRNIEHTGDLKTGNDNFGHGLMQALDSDSSDGKGAKEYDGNDRGRTFSFGTFYKAKGSRGELRLGLESNLFGTLSLDPDGRSQRNEDGSVKHWSKEQNILDLSYRGYLRERTKDDKAPLNYVIAGTRYTYETDDGFLSQDAQEGWHKLFKDQGQVQYDNQEFLDDDHTFTIYGGMGREWVGNLGNWKCRAVAEGVLGAGHSTLTGAEFEAGGRGEFHLNSGSSGGRSEYNPWFALSVWGESLYNTQDEWSSRAGLEMSTSFKAGRARIQPYIGVEYHDTVDDRFFGAHEGDERELYHTLGVRVSFGGRK